MRRLGPVASRRVVRALEKIGFKPHRQQGSHLIMRKENPKTIVPVPQHREIGRGLLRVIIKQAGLTVDQFLDLL